MKENCRCPHCGVDISLKYETDLLTREIDDKELDKKLLLRWDKLLPCERDILRYIGLFPEGEKD